MLYICSMIEQLFKQGNTVKEISKIKGDKDEENKYLNLALNYAKEIDDKELIQYLEKKLS